MSRLFNLNSLKFKQLMATPFSQQPHSLLLVRPASFGFNAQTSGSNAFQLQEDVSRLSMQKKALVEFDQLIDDFNSKDISCLVVEDTLAPEKPDAIFPNNWFTTHEDGKLVLYPMLAENRRLERRIDIIDLLKSNFDVKEVIDLSGEEHKGHILEGTGSILFDHMNRIAYACRSPRTDEPLFKKTCLQLEYEPIIFDAVDENMKSIYHTNVMLWIGEKTVGICLDSIKDEDDQERVLSAFERTQHKVVAISYEQMRSFAGNMLEVKDKQGERYLAMSTTALNSLLPGQLNEVSKYAEPLPVSISAIEKYGGGGIRCMLAGIHLPFRH